MCGRFVLATPVSELARAFGFADAPNLPARYNVAPTQEIAAVAVGKDGTRKLVPMRWGLVPRWADDPSIGSRMINARSETAPGKPAFRDAWRRRRCLIPADGFYEWAPAAEAGGRKRPMLIRRRDRAPMAFAGLWETWRGPKAGPPLDPPMVSATILTTSANVALRGLHDRMPAILDDASQAAWLDADTPEDALPALIRPAADDLLDAVEVSARVNSVRNDDADCVRPLAGGEGEGDGDGPA